MKLFRIITVAFLFNIARASAIDECIHCIKTKKIFVRNLFSWSRKEYACINTTEILDKEAYLPLFRACAIPHCLCIDSVIKNLSTLKLCREKIVTFVTATKYIQCIYNSSVKEIPTVWKTIRLSEF